MVLVKEKIKMDMISIMLLVHKHSKLNHNQKAENKRLLEMLELKIKCNKSRIYFTQQADHYMKFIKKRD